MTHRTAAACALALAVFALPQGAVAAIQQVAGPGSGPAQVNRPTSISVNSAGELVVGDAGNARVQKLTRAGGHLLSFNVPYGSGAWDPVLHTAVSGSDDIYASFAPPPSDGGRVSQYTTSGALVRSWGGGYDASSLSGIAGVAVDGTGHVYVAADDLTTPGSVKRIVRYTAEGLHVGEWQVRDADGLPRNALAIAARGSIVTAVLGATETAPAQLVRYDPSGAVLSRTPQVALGNARGLTVAASGELYAAAGSAVHQFSPAGELISSFDSYDAPPYAPYPTDQCAPRQDDNYNWTPGLSFTGVAVDELGDVYATDITRNSVVRINAVPVASLDWGPRPYVYYGGFVPQYNVPPSTGDKVSFSAARSRVPFGTATKYEWDFDGDGTFEVDTGTEPTASKVYVASGTYEVKMRVTGSRGASAVAGARIPVSESQVFVHGPGIGLTGHAVTFHMGSANPGCSTTKYTWDLDGDGTFETVTTGPKATKTYESVGTTVVRLRVIRGGVRVDEASMNHETRPAPPAGPVGVTINDGAQFTNDPIVYVNPIWPKFANKMLVANDGGFRAAKSFPLTPSEPWRLNSSGPERLPKTIYVRFQGVGGLKDAQTFTDDIILDETKPLVVQADILAQAPGAPAAASKRRSVRLRVRARDNLSGVSRMQVTPKRSRPGKWRRMRRVSRVRTSSDKLWVRVRDKAGNRSRWKLAR